VVYPSARFVPQRVIVFRDILVNELKKMTSRCEERAPARRKREAP
jgi:hypothetical protein